MRQVSWTRKYTHCWFYQICSWFWNPQRLEYFGKSFKSFSNPRELKHANVTFIRCLMRQFLSWASKREKSENMSCAGGWWEAVERRKRRRGREIVPGWGRLRKEGIRSNASISPVTEVAQLAIHPSLPTFCTSQQNTCKRWISDTFKKKYLLINYLKRVHFTSKYGPAQSII